MFLLFFSPDATVWSCFSTLGLSDHLWVWRLQTWSLRADLQKSSGTWHLKEMLGAVHGTRSGGQKGRKIYGQQSPSSHQASVLENVIVLWSIKGGAWASVGEDNG